MRSAIAVITFFVLMLPIGAAPPPQLSGNTLRGVVRVAGDVGPSLGVRVQLQQFGMTIQDTVLHEKRFEFSNLTEGRYTLIAAAAGYETVRQDIDVPGEWPIIELHSERNGVKAAEAVSVWNLRVPPSARRQFDAAKNKLRNNNCAGALSNLKKAVQTYADYGDAHQAMGECYSQLNQLDAAEQEFKLALEQPHLPELHLRLAKVYVLQNRQPLLELQVKLYAAEQPQQRDR